METASAKYFYSENLEVNVNGIPYLSEDEVAVGIGEIIELSLRLVTPTNGIVFNN